MSALTTILIIFLIIIIIWILWGIISPFIWEQPEYEILIKSKSIEIRKYKKTSIISTKKGFRGGGFSELSSYIFGKNLEKQKIAMTTPVLSEKTEEGERMVFFLPKKMHDKELPTPISTEIDFISQKEQFIGTIRFFGLFNTKKAKKAEIKLLEFFEKQGIKKTGNRFNLQYSDPFVPPFMRKNEIGYRINPNSLKDL